MKCTLLLAALIGTALSTAVPQAAAAINIIATTSDLASIVSEVGGDKVTVESLARGYQDPHFVEAKPSFVFKLNKADLLVLVGRDLEAGWLPALITQSRNPRIQAGADGYFDASLTARIVDMPSGPITRAMGDVHPLGNPHYWLDPENGRRIAKAVQAKLAQKDPANAAYYAQRAADFDRRLAAAQQRWKAMMAPYKGIKVVTYHRSWANFAEAFGIDVIGYVEPKPGIPPTPQHTLDVIQAMRSQGVKLIIVEPYFDSKTPNSIASQSGGKVLVLPPSVGGIPAAADYLKLFETGITMLVDAITSTGSR